MHDIEERKELYGCDGCCYGKNTDLPDGHPDRRGMCSCVDTCPETSMQEGIGCAMAVVLLLGVMILPIIAIFILIAVIN